MDQKKALGQEHKKRSSESPKNAEQGGIRTHADHSTSIGVFQVYDGEIVLESIPEASAITTRPPVRRVFSFIDVKGGGNGI